MRWQLCLVGFLAQSHGQERVATTTAISDAMAKAYRGRTALPYAKPGAPPTDVWKDAARTKYEATELAALDYMNLDALDKRFRNIAVALAMDWELFAADTYPLLQANYESVHPWRTGRIVRENWTEAEGNRFAAITSSVGDVLLMELTKHALLLGPTWPNFDNALFFGQFQEIVAEKKLTHEDWQYYQCDEKLDPVLIQHNATFPTIHFVPQLTWITMPLDAITFVSDLLMGDSKSKWASYDKRGAALWEEYRTIHSPVIKDILKKLGNSTNHEHKQRQAQRSTAMAPPKPRNVIGPGVDELVVQARAAIDLAVQDYSSGSGLSARTYEMIRSLYLAVGIGTNSTMPTTLTCVGSQSAEPVTLV